MSDESVANALRSDATLVVIEAPAVAEGLTSAAQHAYWLSTTTRRGRC
jgi:hypothetical protein